MARQMTAAQARREWAKVLKSAQRGTPVEVTRNGEPVAVVVSIGAYRAMERAKKETLSDAVARLRRGVDPRDLEGPDPWADVRDRSPGRAVDLE